MQNVPLYLAITFGLTTLLTVFLFYKAANNSDRVLYILFAWLLVQAVISLSLFYTQTNVLPPRFMLLVLPPLVITIALFATKKGRSFIDGLNLKYLTILHVVRIAVELVLYGLFAYYVVPEVMTFEGNNYDILAGISAPVVFYLYFTKGWLNNKWLLAWNVICLLLLINIVVTAVLSAPSPFQRFGYEQPNIAVLYFPFTWLPGCIVPLVLFSHLAAIRHLTIKEKIRSSPSKK